MNDGVSRDADIRDETRQDEDDVLLAIRESFNPLEELYLPVLSL